MLEEFSDSMKSLNWENIYAKPIEFKSKIEKALELELMEKSANIKINNEDVREEDEDEDGEEEEDDDDGDVEGEEDESSSHRNIDSKTDSAYDHEGNASDEDENSNEDCIDQGEKNAESRDEEINSNSIFEIENSALGGDLAGFLDDESYVFPLEVEKLFLQDEDMVVGDDEVGRSSSSKNGLTVAIETPITPIREMFYQDREVIDLLTPESTSPNSLSPRTVPEKTMDECLEDSNGFEGS